MPFLTDTDFLASSLWPNNPSLHPPILYGLFKDWDGVTPYDAASLPTLIYADMRTESAKALVQMDNELTTIVKKLSVLYPHNQHLKSDFSMCAACRRYDENHASTRTRWEPSRASVGPTPPDDAALC